MIAAHERLIGLIGIIAFAHCPKSKIPQQSLKATVALVKILVMTESRKPTCVIVPGLVWINFPGVQVKHLWAISESRGITEKIAKNGIRELSEVASARSGYRNSHNVGGSQREFSNDVPVGRFDGVGS